MGRVWSRRRSCCKYLFIGILSQLLPPYIITYYLLPIIYLILYTHVAHMHRRHRHVHGTFLHAHSVHVFTTLGPALMKGLSPRQYVHTPLHSLEVVLTSSRFPDPPMYCTAASNEYLGRICILALLNSLHGVARTSAALFDTQVLCRASLPSRTHRTRTLLNVYACALSRSVRSGRSVAPICVSHATITTHSPTHTHCRSEQCRYTHRTNQHIGHHHAHCC